MIVVVVTVPLAPGGTDTAAAHAASPAASLGRLLGSAQVYDIGEQPDADA